jgi:membrane associated rhomboid family serine protease
MNLWDNIKQTFRQGNFLVKLIYINIAVFVLLKLLMVGFRLFNVSGEFLTRYLAVPSDLTQLLYHAWTLLTYMFLHEGFFHLFFNMLCLYWFGKMFLLHFSEKQLLGLYLIGGFVAAAFYIIAYNLFPYYAPLLGTSLLLGASGSVMAVIVASAVKSPNSEMNLFLIGAVKLKYIAIVVVLISFFGITSDNGGGELAHLGGAFAGYLFALSLSKGRDITKGLNRFLDGIFTLFSPVKMKVSKKSKPRNSRMSDGDYNRNKVRNMAEIDRILDKIKASGYDSLTADEKRKLFDQGR